MPRTLDKECGAGRVLYAWWKGLDEDRAGRAALRRASDITAISLTGAYQRLYRKLCDAGWMKTRRNDALAAAVGLLAHVRTESTGPVAASMSAAAKEGESPEVSELRFMRLLESPDLDALFTGMRRALPLFGSHVDVLELANDIVEWGDNVKKEWAYTYHWPTK